MINFIPFSSIRGDDDGEPGDGIRIFNTDSIKYNVGLVRYMTTLKR